MHGRQTFSQHIILTYPTDTCRQSTQITTLLSGAIQQRMGPIEVEDYYQPLMDPQALQLDTRQDDLGLLYLSDYGTGYIYSVGAFIGTVQMPTWWLGHDVGDELELHATPHRTAPNTLH